MPCTFYIRNIIDSCLLCEHSTIFSDDIFDPRPAIRTEKTEWNPYDCNDPVGKMAIFIKFRTNIKNSFKNQQSKIRVTDQDSVCSMCLRNIWSIHFFSGVFFQYLKYMYYNMILHEKHNIYFIVWFVSQYPYSIHSILDMIRITSCYGKFPWLSWKLLWSWIFWKVASIFHKNKQSICRICTRANFIRTNLK